MNTNIDTKKPTRAEIAQLEAIASEIETARAKWHAISDKYPRCGECGAWYGELHNKDCDCNWCLTCAKQINLSDERGCKCETPVMSIFED